MTDTPITRAGAYRPRPITFLGLHETAGWRLKFYSITAGDEGPRPGLVKVAETLAPRVLPTPAVHSATDGPHDLDRYGIGFVIADDAEDYAFTLFDWWAGESELHQRMFSALPTRLGTMRPHPTLAVGSVRELAVIEFERRAWLRHVLANPEGPDIEAYLCEHCEAEV